MTQEEIVSRIPLGNSEFSSLRSTGKIYVDKTDLIYKITTLGKMSFLSRPRRFGKSLLISTLASLFAHGLRDFKGLAIEKLWTDKTYPVLRLDFSEVKDFSSGEHLNYQLVKLLDRSIETAGLDTSRMISDTFPDRFAEFLIGWSDDSLVLLIDEYDAPFTNHLDSPKLFEEARMLFSSFYSKVKARNGAFRQVFMTGITRFNQTSIFSAFNNLIDISLDSQFGSLLGYTDKEIDTYFSDAIDLAANNLSLPRTVVRQRLKDWYDGYCFEETGSVHVYTPWSVLTFLTLSHRGFRNYWYQTATPTVLRQYLTVHSGLSMTYFNKPKTIDLSKLMESVDYRHINPVALMVHAGYLTIKRVNSAEKATVGYPNLELMQSMGQLFIDMATNGEGLDEDDGQDLLTLFDDLQIDAAVALINKVITMIDYSSQTMITREDDCRSFLQVILCCSKLVVTPEVHYIKGRSDLEAVSKKWYWVFELKYHKEGGKSVETLLSEAKAQVIDRRYGERPYMPPLKRLAMVFSDKEHKFVAWDWVDAVDAEELPAS